jgi:methionine synthase I (cobalamin-dependent)
MIEVAPEALFWTEPNAGLPQLIDNQVIYKIGPERFDDYAEKVVRMGVKVIGTCCGTTPDYIRSIVKRVENYLN